MAPLGGILLVGPDGATITLRAIGGPVTWSIRQASLLGGTVPLSPTSGRLSAGQRVTVTVTAGLLANGDVLSVSPCGHSYVLVVGLQSLTC